jgi:hypothetical protein
MCHICRAVEHLKEQEEKEMNIEELTELTANLKAKLNDALDLLENCGYCRKCLWDKESIGYIIENTIEAIWPKDCTPLCEECNAEFVESIENKINSQEELKTLFKCDECKEEPCVCTQILPTYEEQEEAQ